MSNTFTKHDLKAGMVVQLRRGDMGLIVPYGDNDELILVFTDDTFSELISFNVDLTHSMSKYLDIVKVYSQNKYMWGYIHINTENRQLLWERKEEDEKRKENIKKKIEMLEQREKLIKQVNDLEIQIDTIEESYKKFMDENFKGDSAYYIPDDFKQQVIVISRDRISNGYKIRL